MPVLGWACVLVVLVGAVTAGALIGPVALPPGAILLEVLGRLPFVHVHSGLSAAQAAILWQIRLLRVVLGLLVGSMLSLAGSAYQGVFRNPLADPYLLGAALIAFFLYGLATVHLPPGVSLLQAILPVPDSVEFTPR